MNVGETITFNYTGSIQTLTFDTSGYYEFDVYGAQGGRGTSGFGRLGANGGQGGHVKAYKKCKKGDVLYIGVGGQGAGASVGDGYEYYFTNVSGGYNGGGIGHQYSTGEYDGYVWGNAVGAAGGGGASHIATFNRGTLPSYSEYQSEVLLIAGGGGGGIAGQGRPEGSEYARGGGSGGSGGGASYGQGSSYGWNVDSLSTEDQRVGAGGGGGLAGGSASNRSGGNGGTNYTAGMPAISIGGIEYAPVSESGKRSGHGQVIVTLLKKLSVYVGDNGADMYIGDNAVDSIYLGDNEA